MSKFKEGDKVVMGRSVLNTKYQGLIYEVRPSSDFKGFWIDTFNQTVSSEYVNKGFRLGFGDFTLSEENPIKPDAVNSPKHYSVFEDVEAIQVIAGAMTEQQFYGYCLGNILKYRLRAGGKDDVMQELGKADKYQELYNQHKHLCRG